MITLDDTDSSDEEQTNDSTPSTSAKLSTSSSSSTTTKTTTDTAHRRAAFNLVWFSEFSWLELVDVMLCSWVYSLLKPVYTLHM